jgi:hypothetical protein
LEDGSYLLERLRADAAAYPAAVPFLIHCVRYAFLLYAEHQTMDKPVSQEMLLTLGFLHQRPR